MMKVGDIVRFNRNIPEYLQVHDDVGIVIEIYEPETDPMLLGIQWPGGELEKLYDDEIELVSNHA